MRSRLISSSSALVAALSLVPAVLGNLSIDFTKPASIRAAARTVAESLVNDYTSQDPLVPGIIKDYSFFESGLFFNTLIDYAAYTGDSRFNSLFQQDFYSQIGPDANFIPINQSTISNDAVGFWALAAMTAAEYGAEPGNSDLPSYLDLAVNVFNNFVSRWDSRTCDGGLRMSILPESDGYDFKDSTSNGIFFQLAARLGIHTKNETYLEWAEEIYEWADDTRLIDQTSSAIYSGASVQGNCKSVDKKQWSASQSVYLYGAAAMANATKDDDWSNRAISLASYVSANYFGPTMYVDDGSSQVVLELACEENGSGCTNDEKAGKSVLFRSISASLVYYDVIGGMMQPQLNNSARNAAKSCNDQGECSFVWTAGEYVASAGSGIGEKMAALESFIAVLKDSNPKANTTVFSVIAEDNGNSQPSNTDTGSPSATDSGDAPAETTTGAPSSASRMVVGSFLGVASAVFLQMLL